jgi:hypothetical protein
MNSNVHVDINPYLDITDDILQYESMTDAFVGTKRIRFGARPNTANLLEIDTVMKQCVDENRPVEISLFWSGSKGYNSYEINTVDFLDVMALKRIETLHEGIRLFHDPGIKVTLIWEDFTEKITADGGYRPAYYNSFVDLIKSLGMNYVNVVMESSLCDEGDMARIVQNNAIAMLSDRPETVGWVGELPWNHYMPRARSEFPYANDDQLRESIAVYFGIVLARYQTQMVPKHDLKLSFCPYPKTAPQSMKRRRAEYKVKPNKDGHRTAAPWSSFGLLRQSKRDWTHISAREACQKRYVHVLVNLNNYALPVLTEPE